MASEEFPEVSIRAAYECGGTRRRLIHLDFLSMRETEWLTTPIVECFQDIMMQEAAKKKPEIFDMSPTALQYMSMGVDSYVTEILSSPKICKDLWCVPSNLSGNHFVLFLVIIKEKRIIILNSSQRGKKLSPEIQNQLQVQFGYNFCNFVPSLKQSSLSSHFTPSSTQRSYLLFHRS